MSTLLAIIIVLFVIWLISAKNDECPSKKEGFGVEKRPFNYGNEYNLVNPFDEMDYITPAFYRY